MRVLGELSKNAVQAAARRFAEALDAHSRGALNLAEEGYRATLGLDPLHVSARNNLALLLLGRGEVSDAVALLEEALAIAPDFADGWNNLGAAHRAADNLEAARAALIRAVALGHGDAPANLARLEAQAGRAREAGAAAAQAYARRPSAEMAKIAAKAALTLGDAHAAGVWSRRWFEAAPHDVEAFAALAACFRSQPALMEAAARRHLELVADNATAWNALGVALQAQKRSAEALEAFDRLLELAPDDAHAHNNRATALKTLGRYDEALEAAERACALRADYPEARNTLGNVLSALERLEEALAAYEAALAIRPDFLEAAANAILALSDLDRAAEGLERLKALQAVHGGVPLLAKVEGVLLVRLERFAEAEPPLRRALAAFPDDAEVQSFLGISLHQQGYEGEAEELLTMAIPHLAKPVGALNALGNLYAALGRGEEATATLQRAIEWMPDVPGLYRNLAGVYKYRRDDGYFGRLEALYERRETLSSHDQVELLYALAEAYDDVGERERAWDLFVTAGRMRRRQLDYDPEKMERIVEQLRRVFTRDLYEGLQGRGYPSRLPVFIVGMPRSGTTLMEQILAAHPKVFAAGELSLLTDSLGYGLMIGSVHLDGMPVEQSDPAQALPIEEGLLAWGRRYVEALRRYSLTAWRITDKMPGNYAKLGLIALAMPGARIIHMRRHPLDTCLSCFRTRFAHGQEWSYDLGELGRYYSGYWRLMAHWREVCPEAFLEVDYERLVTDTEGEARRVLDYVGLPWHDACLSFYKVDRPVHTASLAQVRRPIYTSSMGKWQPLLPKLSPLIAALDPEIRRAYGIPDPKGEEAP